MFSSAAVKFPRRLFRSLLCAMFLALLPGAVYAQLGGTGIDDDRASGMRQGNNTIVGQVLLPPGVHENRRFTVRLSSVRVGEFSTMTDDNGVFTFRRLREGSYFIIVEAGRDYVPAQETVDLYDNRPHTTTVQIELHPRPAATAKPGVLNAALVGLPKAAVEHYQQGLAAVAAGDNKKAIQEFNAALSVYPQFVLALNELSAIYVNAGELEKAEDALTKAIGFEPNNATLRLNHGYVLLLKERFVEAEQELHRAIELRDDLVTAHLYRGRVLIRLGRLDEAEAELKHAIERGGNTGAIAYRYLGALYSERGDAAKAIEALEKYLKLMPTAKDVEQVRAIIKQLNEQPASKK